MNWNVLPQVYMALINKFHHCLVRAMEAKSLPGIPLGIRCPWRFMAMCKYFMFCIKPIRQKKKNSLYQQKSQTPKGQESLLSIVNFPKWNILAINCFYFEFLGATPAPSFFFALDVFNCFRCHYIKVIFNLLTVWITVYSCLYRILIISALKRNFI